MSGSLGALSSEAFASLGSMEGMYAPVVEVAPAAIAPDRARLQDWPGFVGAAVVTAGAYAVHYLPFPPFRVVQGDAVRHPISAAIIAILLGLLIRNLLPVSKALFPGCKRIVKQGIPIAIVLMGAGLNLSLLASLGLTALLITICGLVIAIVSTYYVGRAWGLNHRLSLLIGAGTGICGSSAIVAVAPLIDADDEDLVLSIGTVNLFALLAMLAFPLLGAAMHMGSQAFGIWAGTTIHAVPQVVAAGFAHSADAGTLATLVKLVRVTLLAPMVFVLAIIFARHHAHDTKDHRVLVHYARLVPWFVWGFVAMSIVGTLGLLPNLTFQPNATWFDGGPVSVSLVSCMTQVGNLLLALAMAAIGLEVNLRLLAGVSSRAVATGLLSTLILGGSTLAMISLLM